MEREKIKHFKNRLVEEREKLLKSREDLKSSREESMERNVNELSSYDNHPGDLGTEVYMKEQDEAFIKNMDKKLDEIDISLEMVEEGRYGKCRNCDKKIDEERLEIIPYVKKCLECSEEDELPLEYRQFESLEDEYATKPSNDPDSNVIYDRDDTYQDVAEDNIVPGDPSMSTGDNIGLSKDGEEDGVEEVESLSDDYGEEEE